MMYIFEGSMVAVPSISHSRSPSTDKITRLPQVRLFTSNSLVPSKKLVRFIFILSVLESVLTMPGSRPELLQHSEVTVTVI